MSALHQPVMAAEVVAALKIKPHGIYIDTTFGRGGHSRLILEHLNASGTLIALDQDQEAVAWGRAEFAGSPSFKITKARFAKLNEALDEALAEGELIDGLLADLGVSSPQLDNPERGFSFNLDGPIDMRMDQQSGTSAGEWLSTVSVAELAKVLREFGQERYSMRIARAIVAAKGQLRSTLELADLIASVVPSKELHKHPATRSFQAIRIAVNQEQQQLRALLSQALQRLKIGGRLVVISFHSLEDKMVKAFMRQAAKGDPFPPDLPVLAEALHPELKLIGKAVRPSDAEVRSNRRARSATLRVAEKIA